MSIQTDILDTIGDGGIEVAALRGKLGNVGANELDCAVNALLRARRLQISFGRYELIPSMRIVGHMPHRKLPSAEEEAAASLLPATRVCVTCKGEPQELHQFRHVGPGETRSDECNGCYRKRPKAKRTLADIHVTAPVVFHSAQRSVESVNGGSGETSPATSAVEPTNQQGSVNLPGGAKPSPTSSANSKSPQREGDNRDVSTEHAQKAAAVPETSGSYSRSDPSEDARTPASAERVPPVLVAAHPFDNSPFAKDPIFTRVTMRKRAVLNRVALLQVELENLMSEARDCDRFVELYERFSTNAPGAA